jgi:hypothetical protein
MGQDHSEYRKMWLLAISAFCLSAAVIAYYNFKMYPEQIANVCNQVELMRITFMPYMISAVVSTLTAISIMTMLPMVRSQPAAYRIRTRLKQMGQGDFTADSRVECTNHFLKDIAAELNYTVGMVSSNLAQWKIINRQQWDLLESIRREAVKDKNRVLIGLVERMEENWKMVAQIEDRFTT